MGKFAFAMFLFSCCLPAFAVYKCESEGKILYSDAPCAQGKETQLSTPDTGATANNVPGPNRPLIMTPQQAAKYRIAVKTVNSMENLRQKIIAGSKKDEERRARMEEKDEERRAAQEARRHE